MEIINGKQIYDSKLRVNCAHFTYKECAFVLKLLSLSPVCVFVSQKKKKKLIRNVGETFLHLIDIKT